LRKKELKTVVFSKYISQLEWFYIQQSLAKAFLNLATTET